MPALVDSLRESAAAVADLGDTAESFAALDASQLILATRAISELRRCVDLFAARAAGEIAQRSRRELGHQGIAQRAGFVSAVAMIQKEAQLSKQEATRLVEMGTLLAEVEFSNTILDSPESAAPNAPTPDVITPEWQTSWPTDYSPESYRSTKSTPSGA